MASIKLLLATSKHYVPNVGPVTGPDSTSFVGNDHGLLNTRLSTTQLLVTKLTADEDSTSNKPHRNCGWPNQNTVGHNNTTATIN